MTIRLPAPFRSAVPAALALAAAAVLAFSACRSTAPVAVGDAARGDYLVHRVGLCVDCHSPRDERGEILVEYDLCGSPLPFAPTVPMPWVAVAPRIAGLPTMTDAEARHFLQTGELPGGRRPLPPMPPFRMDERDAADIVAYLRSLGDGAVAASR